ncbi:MAG: hypothetical protein KDA84_16295, partial [Planctomycetaceae bacterium]|nr:hypothetical protein [Planctomycetaceae bacterium]
SPNTTITTNDGQQLTGTVEVLSDTFAQDLGPVTDSEGANPELGSAVSNSLQAEEAIADRHPVVRGNIGQRSPVPTNGERIGRTAQQMQADIDRLQANQILTQQFGEISEEDVVDGLIEIAVSLNNMFNPYFKVAALRTNTATRGLVRGHSVGAIDPNDILGPAGVGDNQFYGEDGDDELRGHKGNDLLDGGEGNDVIFGGQGSDLIRGGAGDDIIRGGSGGNIIIGGEGDDDIQGGNGRDLLIGGVGADFLRGRSDDDILIAGFTDYDADDDAIYRLFAEWQSPLAYADRVDHIKNGTGSLAGTGIQLSETTIGNDDDLLEGGNGLDLIFGNFAGDSVFDKLLSRRCDSDDETTDV